MLLKLDHLFALHGITPRGVLQAGAHIGQEVELFASLGITHGVFFEPLPHIFAELQPKMSLLHSGVAINCALGATSGTVTMHVEEHPRNRGMSSSCLKPNLHTTMSPEVVFSRTLDVPQKPLDHLLNESWFYAENYNYLCMDVQGYELEVLKGATEILPMIEVISTEINTEELYESCVQLPTLDAFLAERGFARISTHMAHKWWGDALYVRR